MQHIMASLNLISFYRSPIYLSKRSFFMTMLIIILIITNSDKIIGGGTWTLSFKLHLKRMLLVQIGLYAFSIMNFPFFQYKNPSDMSRFDQHVCVLAPWAVTSSAQKNAPPGRLDRKLWYDYPQLMPWRLNSSSMDIFSPPRSAYIPFPCIKRSNSLLDTRRK